MQETEPLMRIITSFSIKQMLCMELLLALISILTRKTYKHVYIRPSMHTPYIHCICAVSVVRSGIYCDSIGGRIIMLIKSQVRILERHKLCGISTQSDRLGSEGLRKQSLCASGGMDVPRNKPDKDKKLQSFKRSLKVFENPLLITTNHLHRAHARYCFQVNMVEGMTREDVER